jgi:hypothetical protein
LATSPVCDYRRPYLVDKAATNNATPQPEPEEMRAYKASDPDALRAYHLDRVFSKFNTVISAENAEILAGLLGIDEEATGNAA